MEIHTVGQRGEVAPVVLGQRYQLEPLPRVCLPEVLESAAIARSIMRARADRRSFFEHSMFSEPAWDILLELFVEYAAQRRIQTSAIGASASIPLTTTLRWLNILSANGLIERTNDRCDGRRVFVGMSEQGASAMVQYIRSLEESRLILSGA